MFKKVIRRIKLVIHHSILSVVDTITKKNAVIKEKTLLVIRVDAIGDYILFRNFLKVLRESEQFTGYSITLLGNETWKELAESLDADYIDNFIWLNRNKFYRNYYYRIKKIREISAIGYDILLNPMYSKETFYSETLVKVITANKKIAGSGENNNLSEKYKRYNNSYYSDILDNKKVVLFEFYRNQEFFEELLAKKLNVKLSINKNKLQFIKDLPKKYVVLFLGASHPYRQWSARNFALLGLYLKQNHGYEIIICGAKSDYAQAHEFHQYFNEKYIDLVGKTSLLELLSIINQSQFIVSNETSAVHFAVALSIAPIFVIYNGNHFGRFTPYPEELCNRYYLIAHPFIEKDAGYYQMLSNNSDYNSLLNIEEITLSKVIDNIEANLY